ncbi:phage major capsid protein [Pedobacter africanus]|uniref:Phage major capsid protein, HK97 family n=1 Tax=Pedobacter africanus TaxID=151894 RepID=A0A1W1ZBJ4_9SPHI|nr:phage major capsid protein [Pedobacter africanus]SMC45793.1 phage major capsid protein, HK97 family [Pedobacter africanus]
MEDLKQELETLKADLSKNFETKSKVDIQAAITEFETKSKGIYDAEIKSIKDDFEAKSAAMQEHLDKLDIRLQEAKKGEKLETKTFNQILGETIRENADAIKNHKTGEILKMELKAVGDMSIAANFPGSTPFNQEVRNALIQNPYDRVWLSDYLPQGSTTKGSIIYPKENGGEGGAATWVTGSGNKAQMDFDLTSQSAFVKWIAGFVIVDREMLDDIEWIASYIQSKMLISLKVAENNFILNGTSDSNPVDGLLDVATAYNGDYTAAVDKIVDAAYGQIPVDTFEFYQGNTAIFNVRDAVAIGLNKASGSGEYDLPAGSVSYAAGKLSVAGLNIATTTQLGANNFLAFDRMATLLVNRLAPELRMFEDAALAKQNKVMFRIEERITLAIFNDNAIVKGSLAQTT